ncbi:MAG: DNA mismatch repair protein MutS [Flavobacteriia bacterium]|nr:DNA mismatch repair protein MutS [Flavobacteriia bacterium]
MKEKEVHETPLMKQYNQIKSKHPEALLLFRVGDFYETFGEDAVVTSKVLGIVLTKRKNGAASHIELAGFPHHSLDNYLPKLIRAGYRVAVCDQLEDPKMTKTIVKRGVTELLSPGIAFNDQVLDSNKNNFLCALHFNPKNVHGIAFLDISTGEFIVSQGNTEYIEKLIHGFDPSEIIYQKKFHSHFQELFNDNFYTFRLDDWVFKEDFAQESLNKHFGTKNLKGFGVDDLAEAIIAAGAILHYLSENQHDKLSHVHKLSRMNEDNFLWLDRFTVRNLELTYSQNENAKTLIDVMDNTLTPMGSRLLKRWMLLPLKDQSLIQERLDAVEQLIQQNLSQILSDQLKNIGDLERLISKVAVSKVNPKEIKLLEQNLQQIQPIKKNLSFQSAHLLKKISDQLNPCETLKENIQRIIIEEPAIQIGKGMVINHGVNNELDELREILYKGKDYLADIQLRESMRTGIPSLKISFNNVFGYYLEVTNVHKDKVPSDWIRKQTLVNAERYITEELKEYEHKILGAEDKILELEGKLYKEFILSMLDYIPAIQLNANLLAQLDCLLSFSISAQENHYCKPEINNGLSIDIQLGRHPVIEKRLKHGEEYIANDVFLDEQTQQIIMLTGPNMSGKSALLRQTALICLMAQMGSYVPAKCANLGLVDKIFTRVGASDNLSSGESTFMVEMNETASILNNLSERSLIILDEIGRGTSTYDGISIAWAIAEFLHEYPLFKSKTLFATHYHELNEMESSFERIKNYHISVHEKDQKILFLRKMTPGGSEHSFGIHVAKLAGMPQEVINRSKKLLTKLEKNRVKSKDKQLQNLHEEKEVQLSFFQMNDPVLEQIRDELVGIDINTYTPVEALMKLHELKKWLGG